MNYRHAFHAGGFADVIKHIVLVRILVYLHEKPAAFRVIDSHAGAGRYDLAGEEGRRGGEWLTGIDRVMQARFSEGVLALLTPYLDIVRAFNPPGSALIAYPGSPLFAHALLRPQDRITACEVEPSARRTLIDALRRDPQARVVDLDGWTALPAFVPPNERRGLVLIDPPFEKDEFDRLEKGFAAAFAKWPTGIYVLWYPAKSRRATDELAQQVARLAASTKPAGKCLRLEFSVAPHAQGGQLTSSGLLIVNAPWTLQAELKAILPELQKPLGQGGAARYRLEMPRP